MELISKVDLSSSPSNIIELQDGNFALTIKKSVIILSKDTYQIKETLDNHEKEINRVLETKNRKLITISADMTMVVYELDDNNKYKFLQRIKEAGKINSIIELSTEEILTCNCDDKIRIYKYNEKSNQYELNYAFDVKELVTHAIEVKEGKVLLLTFEGHLNSIKLYCYDLKKKKIEKMILSQSAICWNNHESILNISDKYTAINLFNAIGIIDKENISIIQEIEIGKDFVSVMGLYKGSNSIIFSTLNHKNYILESNEEGIWEKNENFDDSILKDGEVNCYLKTKSGKLLIGTKNGLKIVNL